MNSSSIVDSLTLKGVSLSGGTELPAGIALAEAGAESSSAGLSACSVGSEDSMGSAGSAGSSAEEAGSAGRMGRMARGEKPGGED